MSLSFEKTRGTRTIYFPLETCDDRPADFVVVVRPFQADPGEQFDESDEFEAAIAFCNPVDQFVKRQGRAIAFERLNSAHRIRGAAHEIIREIMDRVVRINKRRDSHVTRDQRPLMLGAYVPDMDEGQIELDLIQIMSYDALSAYFLKKDENRGDQLVLEA
jgi:hypothetical protein